jgi:hypothetical protein
MCLANDELSALLMGFSTSGPVDNPDNYGHFAFSLGFLWPVSEDLPMTSTCLPIGQPITRATEAIF